MERLTNQERATRQRDDRRARIITAAICCARDIGFAKMRRSDVAAAAHCANGLINHEFGTMDALRDEVMRDAIETRSLKVIAEGVVAGHHLACMAPQELKEQALRSLA